MILLHLRSLLALLTPAHFGEHTPWAAWGPLNAHASVLSRRRVTGLDEHSVFGMRRIDTYPTRRDDGVMVATIWDYHRSRVILARRELPAEESNWAVMEGETVGGAWLGMQGLQTLMPFIKIVVPLPEELQQQNSAVMLSLNDDGIVAATVRLILLV